MPRSLTYDYHLIGVNNMVGYVTKSADSTQYKNSNGDLKRLKSFLKVSSIELNTKLYRLQYFLKTDYLLNVT